MRICKEKHIDIPSYKRIAIKHTVSRWGSCSQAGNLNFSYRLALIPSHLAEYVVVHEICHLREFNHSDRFWSLVEQILPDYRERKHELMHISLRT
jgi:predicted metal-dependent hydrolase